MICPMGGAFNLFTRGRGRTAAKTAEPNLTWRFPWVRIAALPRELRCFRPAASDGRQTKTMIPEYAITESVMQEKLNHHQNMK